MTFMHVSSPHNVLRFSAPRSLLLRRPGFLLSFKRYAMESTQKGLRSHHSATFARNNSVMGSQLNRHVLEIEVGPLVFRRAADHELSGAYRSIDLEVSIAIAGEAGWKRRSALRRADLIALVRGMGAAGASTRSVDATILVARGRLNLAKGATSRNTIPGPCASFTSSGQSCARMPIAPDRRTTPAADSAIPATMRIRVDLPEPLRPTNPRRSAPIERVRSLKRTWRSGV